MKKRERSKQQRRGKREKDEANNEKDTIKRKR